MLLYILVGLAFCLGAGIVLGSFFGVTGISLGGVFVCLFTQRVFHPHSRVALAV